MFRPNNTRAADGLLKDTTLRKLFSIPGFAGWVYPKVDTVVSMAPFNNLPTQYGVTIDGEQKWFAQ